MSSADNATTTAAHSTKSAAAAKEDNHPSTGNRKTTSSSRPPEQALKCPRCDSPNTKFCYYNNYSLTQPRHFCKTCRRYWTKGGALRNVPVGGGCRKNKKIKSSCRLISGGAGTDSKDSSSPSSDQHHFGGGLNLKFFHGISPAMDFQLGGLNSLIPSTHHGRHQNPSSTSTGMIYNPLSSSNSTTSFGDSLASNNASPLMGSFDYPLSLGSGSGSTIHHGFGGAIRGHHNINIVHTNLASSIESLSSINQDLHWKLQQQRLAMLFGGDNSQKDQISTGGGGGGGVNSSVVNPLSNQTTTTMMTQKLMPHHHQQQQHQTVPILFQNLEISKPDDEDHSQQCQARKEVTSGADPTENNMEWFFGNSYGQQAQHHHVTANQTPTNSGSNGNDNDNVTAWNSSGAQEPWSAGTDLHQFSALP